MKSWHDVLIAADPPVRFLERHAFWGAVYRGDPVAHNVVRDAAIARHFATDDSFDDSDHPEFSARIGLPFENGVEDLDEYFAGMLLDDRGWPMQFMYYVNAPIKGVVVSVDSQVKTAHAIDVVKERFGLAATDFKWVTSIEQRIEPSAMRRTSLGQRNPSV